MFSRISDALGCSRSKPNTSSEDSERVSWLSQSTETSLFVVPSPNLNDLLKQMGIKRRLYSDEFCFGPLTNLPNASRPESRTPWSVAHSARQRCKLVEPILKASEDLCSSLVRELRTLATFTSENSDAKLFTFEHLLKPISTEAPEEFEEEPADDILILFGSPATVFQLLLATPPLSPMLSDLVLELAACSSPYSQRLLEQFRQPVGLNAMFGSKQAFADTATRLLELFQVVSDPQVQATVLDILPDLASSPCASGCVLTAEDRSLLVVQLIDLLKTTPVNSPELKNSQRDPLFCLIECLNMFCTDSQLSERLHDAYFELLDRCYSEESYYTYLPLITRCLFLTGAFILRSPAELLKLVARFRSYFRFPKKILAVGEGSVDDVLVDLLRITFQFNRNVSTEWMNAINSSNISNCDASIEDLWTMHDQAVQDFLVLCVMYSCAEFFSTTNTDACSSLTLSVTSAVTVRPLSRLQKEVISIIRRLITSGRLCPSRLGGDAMDGLFACHGPLLMSRKNSVFSSFLQIANHLISSCGLSDAGRFGRVRTVGLIMLVKAFCSEKCGQSQRYEIVFELVHHSLVGLTTPTGVRGIRYASARIVGKESLRALLHLAQFHPEKLACFESVFSNLLKQIFTSLLPSTSDLSSPTESDTLPSLGYFRQIFLVLAWIAFSDQKRRRLQEKLLRTLRKNLSRHGLLPKALAVIGAVITLETLCRSIPAVEEKRGACTSTQDADSSLLGSQWNCLEVEARASSSTTSTSRTSNTSCLSLHGPGTGMADDSAELHPQVEDSGDEMRSDHSTTEPKIIVPPSRLLLQLVGLIEHAVGSCPHLQSFWLDELSSSFSRMSQYAASSPVQPQSPSNRIRRPSSSLFAVPSSVQSERFRAWFDARMLQKFQDGLTMDNAPTDEFSIQLNLNQPSACDVAIALGPNWDQFLESASGSRVPNTKTKLTHWISPIVLPSQLALLAILEADRHNGHLKSINSLLGCPLLLPTDDSGSSPNTGLVVNLGSRIDEPQLLIFIINWCVEAVNSFSVELISNVPAVIHSADLDMQQMVILERIRQIGRLRAQLFQCLTRFSVKATEVFENEQGKGSTDLAEICLPTATFEPGKLFSSHPHQQYCVENKRFCFNCGVHLRAPPNSKAAVVSADGVKGLKSKCAAASKSTKGEVVDEAPKTCHKGKRRRLDSATGGDETVAEDMENMEDDESLSDTTADASHEMSVLDHTAGNREETESVKGKSKSKKKTGDKTKGSKMAAGRRKKKTETLSPSLFELEACFREMDLSALTLGLCAWPWKVTGEITQFPADRNDGAPERNVDWTTVSWLLEDFSLKLEHLSGLQVAPTTGWHAFQRLDNLHPFVRSALLLHSVPNIRRILQITSDLFKGCEAGPDLMDSSSSSEEDAEPEKAASLCPANESKEPEKKKHPAQPGGVNFVDLDQYAPNILCTCLECLHLLCAGLEVPNKSGVKVRDVTEIDCLTELTPFMCCCLDRLSVACQDVQGKGAVDLDSGSGSYSIPKRICIEALETGQPLYVDIFETSLEQRELDHGIASYEKNSQISLSKIETILKFFMDMAPSGLPNAVAALFHCRLVCYLSDLHSAYLRCRTEGDDDLGDNIWIPDIFRYTKSLLDREWDTSVRWKGYTYRDSLQSILSAHLRSRPVLEDSSRLKSSIASRLSPDLVLDFTRGLVIPTIRQYIGGQRRSGSMVLGTSGCWVGYRTLTRQTADLYCREIMETILWFTKQLCAVQKGMNNGTVDDPINENLLLAAWNECVVVLCLLVDVMRTSASGGQTDSHLTVSLRPPLMRIGRMFLQLLMKSAMPLLNSLFRHRAVEVTTFLRNTQSLTRYLQRVCTHAKAYRDSQLTNQIPATRRCLETFVYRVKVILSQNHCAEAFWLGTLKNRDLHGVDLQEEESQRSSLAQISSGGSYSQSLPGNTVRSNSDSDSDGNSDTESRPRTIPSSVELDNAADLGRIVGEEEEEEIEDSSETDADVVEASETDE